MFCNKRCSNAGQCSISKSVIRLHLICWFVCGQILPLTDTHTHWSPLFLVRDKKVKEKTKAHGSGMEIARPFRQTDYLIIFFIFFWINWTFEYVLWFAAAVAILLAVAGGCCCGCFVCECLYSIITFIIFHFLRTIFWEWRNVSSSICCCCCWFF